MARDKRLAPNVDNSNPSLYPNGKIQDNTGSGNGTPVNNYVYSDLHEMKDKLFRLYGIDFNGLPDNETNGFQTIDALRALASKNDFILDLTDSSGVLQVPIKLGFMLQNESVMCVSGVDFTTQTQIRGIDNVTYTFNIFGGFKAGEYVRLIKNVSGITLIREVDAVNLNLAVSELSYLKKATQTQENAGAIDTVATTPLTNLTSFIRRVNGVDSSTYLATALQNGIYPKEHFAIVAGIGTNAVRNIGVISGIDLNIGPVGTTYATGGNIVSATKISSGDQNGSIIRVVLQNTMTNTSFYVRSFIESLSTNQFTDSNLQSPTFKPINDTTVDICIKQTIGLTENIKLHLEVVKI